MIFWNVLGCSSFFRLAILIPGCRDTVTVIPNGVAYIMYIDHKASQISLSWHLWCHRANKWYFMYMYWFYFSIQGEQHFTHRGDRSREGIIEFAKRAQGCVPICSILSVSSSLEYSYLQFKNKMIQYWYSYLTTYLSSQACRICLSLFVLVKCE